MREAEHLRLASYRAMAVLHTQCCKCGHLVVGNVQFCQLHAGPAPSNTARGGRGWQSCFSQDLRGHGGEGILLRGQRRGTFVACLSYPRSSRLSIERPDATRLVASRTSKPVSSDTMASVSFTMAPVAYRLPCGETKAGDGITVAGRELKLVYAAKSVHRADLLRADGARGGREGGQSVCVCVCV